MVSTTMALTIRTVKYFYTRVENNPGKAYAILAELAAREISLLAFSAVPYPSGHMELTLFPDDSRKLLETAAQAGWNIIGPQHAILIQGDDHLGALADIHKCLSEARVDIYASTGITESAGHYGYVIYVREDDHLLATRALEKVSSTLVSK